MRAKRMGLGIQVVKAGQTPSRTARQDAVFGGVGTGSFRCGETPFRTGVVLKRVELL